MGKKSQTMTNDPNVFVIAEGLKMLLLQQKSGSGEEAPQQHQQQGRVKFEYF